MEETEFIPPRKLVGERRSPLLPSDTEEDGAYTPGTLYTSMWFDPGETTGWSIFSFWMLAMRSREYQLMENVAYWSAGQFRGSEDDQADLMVDMVLAWPGAHVGVEDFILRSNTQSRSLLAPVRLTAKMTYGMHLACPERHIILQQPALAMTTITDARLKDMNLYNTLSGQEHARDAVRHNLTWAKRAKEILTVQTFHNPNGVV